MAPEKPLSPTVKPMNSDACAMGASRKPDRPASAELNTNAPIITALTLMPIRLATLPLAATARIALPSIVRVHHAVEADHDDDRHRQHQQFLRTHADAEQAHHRVAERRRARRRAWAPRSPGRCFAG